ncbi:MAG TPA: NAD(P)-dependent oxidoreductase [Candidatus Bathyarchaeia archaeon]
MTVLVTGGAGRLGYEVSKLLRKDGFSVRAFDLPGVQWSHVEALGVETFKGDITDPISAGDALRGVSSVVHLAALLPPRSEVSREATTRVNVGGTGNLLKAMASGAHMVLASSISTYGVTAREAPPIREDHPQAAHSYYSESKIAAERLAIGSGRPAAVLRIAPIAVAELLELPKVVEYRADQRVEFVYVEDAARAIASCVRDSITGIINVAGGASWRMNGAEYISRFYGALGAEVEPVFPEKYTAVDWYDTVRSSPLAYQRTSFPAFEEKLRAVGESYGLR